MAPASRPRIYVRGYAGDTAGTDKAVTDPFYGYNQGSTRITYRTGRQAVLLRVRKPLAAAAHGRALPGPGRWRSGALPVNPLHDCAGRHLLPHPEDPPGRGLRSGRIRQQAHGGIAFDVGFGVLEKLRDITGINGADIFGPQRMYEYLTPKSLAGPGGPPGNWDARAMPQDRSLAFLLDRVFCLTATDPTDYDVARGLSAATVGPRSDGLVQIDNAYVPGAYQVYGHRSQSGDRKMEAALGSARLPQRPDTAWQSEALLSVRGLRIVAYERASAQWSSIELQDSGTSVPFVTSFLGPDDAGAMRYALHLRILSLRRRDTLLSFRDHLEQTAHTDPVGAPALSATWNSAITGSISTYRPDLRALDDENPLRGSGSATSNCRHHPPDPRSIRLMVTPGTDETKGSVLSWSLCPTSASARRTRTSPSCKGP
jgi:hypothetical protein